MKSKKHYIDISIGSMKDRAEHILQWMERGDGLTGTLRDYIHPKVLKYLKKKGLVRIERQSLGGTTSRSIAYSTREKKVEVKRIPEPYKKRKAAMDEAGLKYRKSK